MKLQFQIKPFNDLSALELYNVLQLRSEVFVVEQNCVYQDLDGKDTKAAHVTGKIGVAVIAYARIFKKGDYFDNASIGRVVVSEKFRSYKFGYELMQQSIAAVESEFGIQPITISAQLYLKKFYESLGFEQVSETYLEDGIEHIEMLRN